jgi:hypothetical protein
MLPIHHFRKTGQLTDNSPNARMRGASQLKDIANVVLTMNPTRDEAERLIVQTKARIGKRNPPFTVRFDSTEAGGLSLDCGGEPDSDTLGKAKTAELLMLGALAGGQRTRKELLAITAHQRISEKTTDNVLAELANANKIERDEVGREVIFGLL